MSREIRQRVMDIYLENFHAGRIAGTSYNVAYSEEQLSRPSEVTRKQLLQAYYIAELYGDRHHMGHIRSRMRAVCGDASVD